MKVFSRAKGQTSTAAAAYRSALSIKDDRTCVVNDFSRRRGVESVEMFAPKSTPTWVRDPAKLWNAAEMAERINGRPAREWLVALPHELSPEQRQDLVRALAHELVDRYGVAVMAAVHEPSAQGDERNVHAHLLFTTRRVGAGGLGKKVRELDDRTTGPQEVEQLRVRSGEIINRHLAAAGYAERVDHRRLAVQAEEAERRGDFAKAFLLTRIAQRTEGRFATAARRRGERTFVGELNASVRRDNHEVFEHYLGRMERASHQRPAFAPRPAELPSMRRLPRSPSMPSSILAAIERGRGAFGPGGHVINQQSRQAREERRANEEATRRFVRMLEEESARISRNNRNALALYATLHNLQRVDVRSLASHCERDPECAVLLRRSIRLRKKVAEREATWKRSATKFAAASAQTAKARATVDDVETNNPATWRPMRRREWAELRRRQRTELTRALQAERAAAAAFGPKGSAEAWPAELRMQAQLAEVERERQSKFPLPGERIAPLGAKIAVEPRKKIPIKIERANEETPALRLRMSPQARPRRRHRPAP